VGTTLVLGKKRKRKKSTTTLLYHKYKKKDGHFLQDHKRITIKKGITEHRQRTMVTYHPKKSKKKNRRSSSTNIIVLVSTTKEKMIGEKASTHCQNFCERWQRQQRLSNDSNDSNDDEEVSNELPTPIELSKDLCNCKIVNPERYSLGDSLLAIKKNLYKLSLNNIL
jgi:hypothetical protein